MIEIRDEYVRFIRENEDLCRASAAEMAEYLKDHGLVFRGRVMKTLQIPSVFSEAETGDFRRIVKTTYGILEKVIARYLEDPSYRALFPFSKELEELICVPRGYASLLPIARFDIFYNEETGDFKYCEINTDGTSAMNEDRVINEALALNPAHREVAKSWDFTTFELFDSWVDRFLAIYETYDKKKDKPNIAIVDFLDGVSIEEFHEFARRFRARGYSCEVTEIRNLTYEEGILRDERGRQIDLIYRRAVTTDVMEHYEEITPFLDAVRDRAVCLIGAFCTQVVHNKWLFTLLHKKETLDLLTEDERAFVKAHIPFTGLLSESTCDLPAVLSDKDNWIIKPLDSYAASGVYAGCDFSPEEWKEKVLSFLDRDYICQEYVRPYQSLNVDLNEPGTSLRPYANLVGLFVYDGDFAGIYCRLSDRGIISTEYNAHMNASLVATKKAAP